jgi:putative nucleotidyltransferase with HDIG domain
MSNRKESKGLGKKDYILHLILFIASILAVMLIFPLEGKFRYEFRKGKPWLHETLIAPWDFPVRKTDSEIKRERDSLLTSFAPYFNYDSVLTRYNITEFTQHLNSLPVPSSAEAQVPEASVKILAPVKTRLIDLLNSIYNAGILESSDITDALAANNGRITVVRGRVASEVPLDNIYTHKDAYQAANAARNELVAELEQAGRLIESEFCSSVQIYDYVRPNLTYNEETSNTVRERLLRSISPSTGLIQEKELIINRGEIVDQDKFQVLESLRAEYEKRLGRYGSWFILVGRFILITACYIILYLFLYHFRREVLATLHKTVFIILLMLIFVMLTRVVTAMPDVGIYLIPFGIIPIIIRTFYDSRLALFILLVTIMLVGFLVPNSFEFVFMTFIAGVVAIFSLTNIYRRGRLFFSAVMVVVSYSLVYFGIGIIQEGSFSGLNWTTYGWFAGNGALLLLSYPMIFLFEKTFGFLSDATLFELSDTNQPLLRRLAEEAPGSFQHSMQVANLAEEAARAIDANHLLVRTGALYHDIGKLEQSEYFAENITKGFNPHETLTPEESARLIINHIEKGVELAKRYNLPSQIIDFIRTHQGTTRAYYFYHKYSEAHPGEDFDESMFTYPGPKPFSRETAVLMMTDVVEATSRSLEVYTKESVSEMVDTVIENQIRDGQFTDAPITFRDISVIKEVFKKRLINIYHARIAYPARDN